MMCLNTILMKSNLLRFIDYFFWLNKFYRLLKSYKLKFYVNEIYLNHKSYKSHWHVIESIYEIVSIINITSIKRSNRAS